MKRRNFTARTYSMNVKDENARLLFARMIMLLKTIRPLLFCLIALLTGFSNLQGQDFVFENKVYNSDIFSPQAFPTSNPLGFPYLDLGSTEPIEFHFDLIGNDRPTLNFGLIHCDKDWRKTDMLSSAYMSGFQWTSIEDVNPSFSTAIDYEHYHFDFPNSLSYLKRSGNYAVVVFTGTDIEDVSSYQLTYRIIVFESLVGIRSSCTPSSDVSFRRSRQQVDFEIVPAGLSIYSPMRDISATVVQNGDWKRSITGIKPIFIKPDAYTFDYNGPLDFDGGSEYRQFEIKNLQFKSLYVHDIFQSSDGWHIALRDDYLLGTQSYASYDDIDGNYFIRRDGADDSHLEAEYAYVHFRLNCPPFAEGRISIDGQFDRFKSEPVYMEYEENAHAYTATVLMKQGLYNYRYVLHDNYHPTPDLSYTEGNHYETENNYTILVYYSDQALGLDRIIGLTNVNAR